MPNKISKSILLVLLLLTVFVAITLLRSLYLEHPNEECPLNCNDENPCTLDECNAKTNYRCAHTPITALYIPGCTQSEDCHVLYCQEGECRPSGLMVPCCGNGICEVNETSNCLKDCISITVYTTPNDTEVVKSCNKSCEEEAYQWQKIFGKSREWADWIAKSCTEVTDYNCEFAPFAKATEGISPYKLSRNLRDDCNITNSIKRVKVDYYYLNDTTHKPPVFKPGWKNEQDHMQKIKELLELTYPTYEFNVTFKGITRNPQEIRTDYPVIIMSPDIETSRANVYYVKAYIEYDSILPHEFTHLFGIGHNYKGRQENVGCNLPPGETRSIMALNSDELDSGNRFALDIPLDVNNSEKIQKVGREIVLRERNIY